MSAGAEAEDIRRGRWMHLRRRRRARRIILHVRRHLHTDAGLLERPLELALLQGVAESGIFLNHDGHHVVLLIARGAVLASRLLGYYLQHACNHLVSRKDAMLVAALLENMLIRLSSEDAMFASVLPEHMLVHVESNDDAMFAGVLSTMSRSMMMRCSRACCWRMPKKDTSMIFWAERNFFLSYI